MNMPKSRDIQAKMPSPKVILNAFWLVTVKVLNSYMKMRKREGYRMDKLLYGVAYYDEYMPCDRLDKDVEMMKGGRDQSGPYRGVNLEHL